MILFMVAWGLLAFLFLISQGKNAMGFLLALVFGAYGVIPAAEVSLFSRALVVILSIVLILQETATPQKTTQEQAVQDMITLSGLSGLSEPYTLSIDEAHEFEKLLEEARKLHKENP